ncbi:MAG: alpha/beta hydrolase [Clostridia bacterium]|nr:alpha/beta hydrolase [Clostridia bacterium]
MKFYESGQWEAPVLLLLPGTCCHWKKNFGHVLPLLNEQFHVVCVSYDGFDEKEESLFTTVTAQVEKIEQFVSCNFGGHIDAAYGCSLGGSLVGMLVERQNIHIGHAVLGSSDLDQEDGLSARLKAWLIGWVLHGVMQKGRLPGWMRKRLDAKPTEQKAYMEKMLAMMGLADRSMTFVKQRSIRSQFYSDLVTPLGDAICVKDTTVHCFYARKMGDMYLQRYKQHFASPDIVTHDLLHEELLLCQPEKWVQEVCRCCIPSRASAKPR